MGFGYKLLENATLVNLIKRIETWKLGKIKMFGGPFFIYQDIEIYVPSINIHLSAFFLYFSDKNLHILSTSLFPLPHISNFPH